MGKAWDTKERLLGYLSEQPEQQAATKQPTRKPAPVSARPQPAASRQPAPKARRRGCLSAVIGAATVVAVIVAALNVW